MRLGNLTANELLISKLLIEGYKVKDISEELGMSTKNVSTYKAKIKKRINVSDKMNDYVFVSELVKYLNSLDFSTRLKIKNRYKISLKVYEMK